MLTPYGFGMRRRSGAGGGSPYDPSSFFTGGTSGPWYDFGDSTKILNGSGTSATDGQTIATVTDAGTAGINATQGTDANRAILRAAHVNGRNAAECDTSDLFEASGLNAFTNGASSLSIPLVYQHTDGSTNHRFFRQYDNSYSYDRVNALFVALKPSIKYSRDGGDYSNLRTGATDVTAGSYHAMIFVFNFNAGETGLFLDNGTYLSMTAAGGGTVAGNMTASNGNESRILAACKGFIADMYFHKNSMMDGTQRAAWFAAVKSRFNLTGY